MGKAIIIFEDHEGNKQTNVQLLLEPACESIDDMTPAQRQGYFLIMEVRKAMKSAGSELTTHIMNGKDVQ